MNGIVLMALGEVQSTEAIRQKFPVVVERAPRDTRRQRRDFWRSRRGKAFDAGYETHL